MLIVSVVAVAVTVFTLTSTSETVKMQDFEINMVRLTKNTFIFS